MIWHSISFYCFDIIWFNDFSCFVLYSYLPSIQVSQDEFIPSKCFNQGNFLFNHKICALSLEGSMRLLLDYDDNIAWFESWVLVSLAVEYIFFPIWSTFVNLSFNNLLLFKYLCSITGLAFIFFTYFLTFSAAIITSASSLCVHARTNHLHFSYHTLAFTTTTFYHRFASFSFTFNTDPVSAHYNFRSFSIIQIFQSSFHIM